MKKTSKNLLIYYSRSGTNRDLKDFIKDGLRCNKIKIDCEELVDEKNRQQIWGFVKSGRDALRKQGTSIKPLKSQLKDYQRLILISPVWAGVIPPAIRQFLNDYHDQLGHLEIFYGGVSGTGKLSPDGIAEFKNILGKNPAACEFLSEKEWVGDAKRRDYLMSRLVKKLLD